MHPANPGMARSGSVVAADGIRFKTNITNLLSLLPALNRLQENTTDVEKKFQIMQKNAWKAGINIIADYFQMVRREIFSKIPAPHRKVALTSSTKAPMAVRVKS